MKKDNIKNSKNERRSIKKNTQTRKTTTQQEKRDKPKGAQHTFDKSSELSSRQDHLHLCGVQGTPSYT